MEINKFLDKKEITRRVSLQNQKNEVFLLISEGVPKSYIHDAVKTRKSLQLHDWSLREVLDIWDPIDIRKCSSSQIKLIQ